MLVITEIRHWKYDASPPIEEIGKIIRKIKNGKSAEPNGITAEAPKSYIEAAAKMFYVLFRNIWEKEQEPTK